MTTETLPATDPSTPSVPGTPISLQVTTRHATSSDLQALGTFITAQMILAYCHRQKIGTIEYFATPEFAQDMQNARIKAFNNQYCISLAAYAGDEIVGLIEFGPTRWYADLEGKCDSRWEIWCLYTSDTAKGTRLGTRLVKEALRIMMRLDKREEDGALQSKFARLEPKDFLQQGDTCVVLTLEGNSARGFYSKLRAKHKWDCPNYPAGGRTVRVVAYEFDWPTLLDLASD